MRYLDETDNELFNQVSRKINIMHLDNGNLTRHNHNNMVQMENNEESKLNKSKVLLSLSPIVLMTTAVVNYIDPGTGSLIIQVLIASLVGGVFALKLWWSKVKKVISNVLSKGKQEDQPKSS